METGEAAHVQELRETTASRDLGGSCSASETTDLPGLSFLTCACELRSEGAADARTALGFSVTAQAGWNPNAS